MPAEAPIQAERVGLKRIMRTPIPVVPNSQMSFKSIHGINDYFYPHPSIVRQLLKGEKLTPLAQQYFEEKARADTAQAQSDLNAQRAGQAEMRAEKAEAKASLLEAHNGELTARVDQLQNRLDSAFENEDRLLRIIDELRGARQEGLGSTDSNWSVLGLDPKTALAGLTTQQQQVVLDGAYRTRSKIFHPDSGGSKEAMQKVNAAYEALKASIK